MSKDRGIENPSIFTVDKPNEASYHTDTQTRLEGEGTSAAGSEGLLTIQEVCELLKVSKTYIYWLTHKKKIPYIKMQGHLRFRRSAIDNWLRAQEVRNGSSQEREEMVR